MVESGRAPHFREVTIDIKPAKTDASGINMKPASMKKVAVCACKLPRANCEDCKQGYVEQALNGQVPHFIERPRKYVRLAVCKCKKHLQECPDCQEGFLQMTLKGMAPHFMDQEVEDDFSSAKKKEKEEGVMEEKSGKDKSDIQNQEKGKEDDKTETVAEKAHDLPGGVQSIDFAKPFPAQPMNHRTTK